MKWRVVLAVLLLGGVGAVLWQVAGQFEQVTETIDHGPSAEARHNPYLAAERFLAGQGLAVSRSARNDAWAGLVPGDSSLLMLGSRSDMAPAQVGQLLNWVRLGGRLVVVASGLWQPARGSSGDLLLDTLRIRRMLAANLPGAPTQLSRTSPDLTRLYLENETEPALLGFDPAFHLEDPTDKAAAWANSQGATHLMQLDWGDGVITVLSDGALWRNGQVAQYDNAWLLWYLNQGRRATFADTIGAEPWPILLGRHFAAALVASLATLLGWCWYRGVRLGPVLPTLLLPRRRLGEHLLASARFGHRHGGHAALLGILRQDLARRATRHVPGFAQLAVAEQWQVLSRLARVPTATIARAMAPGNDNALSAAAFTARVAELQQIRSML